MPSLIFRSRVSAAAEEVFAWLERPGALQRLVPPWMPVEVQQHEGIRDGCKAVLRIGFGPARLKWVAEHRDYVAGRQFRDVQIKGPFKRWEHTHRVEPDGPDACVLEDYVEYELPTGDLGADRVRTALERQFAYRYRIIERDVAAHQRYARGRKLRIAVSGASGMLGSALLPFLRAGGHTVYPLVRRPSENADAIYWNYREGEIEAEKLEGMDAVIHLAGENIFGLRWTDDKKARILSSRIRGTGFVAETLAKLARPPGVFLSASASGYYGDRGEEPLTEASPPGERGFLAALVRDWEAATHPASEAGIRTVLTRNAPVVSPSGGPLQLMLPAFRLGLGAHIGSPSQYFSWIDLDDYIHALYHALWTDGLRGPVNFASPDPVPMHTFTGTVARVLSRPLLFSIPSTLLRLASGELADEMFLSSARLQPERLLDSGFSFRYAHLEAALRHELGYVRATPQPQPDGMLPAV